MIGEIPDIDHQRIVLPPSDRITGIEALFHRRMGPPVHVHRAPLVPVLGADFDDFLVLADADFQRVETAGDDHPRRRASDAGRFGIVGGHWIVLVPGGSARFSEYEVSREETVVPARVAGKLRTVRQPDACQGGGNGSSFRRRGSRGKGDASLLLDRVQYAVRPPVHRGMGVHRHAVADLQCVARPAPATHDQRRTHLQRPLDRFAAFVRRLDGRVDMRVAPGEFRDGAVECDH